ncbi:hypothetical protein MBLNU457_g2647t1 [Dothideomycetes sp. NU457]
MHRAMASLTLDTSVANKPPSLHRYLDNLGPMSSLPTPTTDRSGQSFSTCVQAVNVGDSIYDDRKALRGIAKKFSQTLARKGERLLAADVMEYLEAAHLPLETLTLSYNIVVELKKPTSTLVRNDSCNDTCSADEYLGEENGYRSEDLLLASLQLAASFRDGRTFTDSTADLFERIGKRLPVLASREAHEITLKTLGIGGYDAPVHPFDGAFSRKKSIRKATGYFDGY